MKPYKPYIPREAKKEIEHLEANETINKARIATYGVKKWSELFH